MKAKALRISQAARTLHDECIVIDGHNDHMIRKYARGRPLDFMTVDRNFDTDGVRLAGGGVTCSLMMVDGHRLDRSIRLMEQAHEEIERHPDELLLVTRVADIRRAKRTGRQGILFTWESGTAMLETLDILRAAYRLGLRVSTVTHNEGGVPYALQGTPSISGYWRPEERAGLARNSGGLTRFGKEAVREMERLGILVDVAHANDTTFADIMDIVTKPVISSHGGAYSLGPHMRCSTDQQIKAIAQTGGLLSIMFHPAFLVPPPNKAGLEHVVDHIAYVADLVGVEHVGIGSDYDGLANGQIPIIPSPERLPVLTEAMLRRGFSKADIRKVWGGNYLRVLRQTIG